MENKEQENPVNQNEEISLETNANENPSDETTLNEEVIKLQQEVAEQKDKFIRLYSEFENYKRRTSKEKLELIQAANEQLIKSLLPVIDDFERAGKSVRNPQDQDAEGFLLIHNKFKKILDQNGVKEMEVGVGSDFNADLQEAITQIPAPEEKLKGKVVDVVEKGYLLNEKVIRFAKVVVGS